MYTDEEIENIFKGHVLSKFYFEKYVEIYKYYKTHDCESNKYNFHHFYPVNYTRMLLERKNRYWTIEEHDKLYAIEDNIVKLPVNQHVIAHYYLAMATLREDDINSFFVLVGKFDKILKDYVFDEVQKLAQIIEENSIPNTINHYVTLSERKELYKRTAKKNKELYEEKHKVEINQKKQKFKQKQKENHEQWKKENAEKLEEWNRQRKEYAKKMREEYKKNAEKNN